VHGVLIYWKNRLAADFSDISYVTGGGSAQERWLRG